MSDPALTAHQDHYQQVIPDTQPNVGVSVPGILASGQYNGVQVNLLPYFNGELASSNRGGSEGVSVNFLDGGGATPIMNNMPANSTSSNQYFLLTHLYEFFGSLLGCSQYGMGAFPAYAGHASMYEVHKFMDLDQNELGYFIEQVALSASSFGVAKDDLTIVGNSLNTLFGLRCSPPATAIQAQGPQLQAICIADSCPVADGAVCDQYQPVVKPMNATGANGTMTSGNGTATATSTGTSGTGTSVVVSSAGVAAVNVAALVAAGFAVILL